VQPSRDASGARRRVRRLSATSVVEIELVKADKDLAPFLQLLAYFEELND